MLKMVLFWDYLVLSWDYLVLSWDFLGLFWDYLVLFWYFLVLFGTVKCDIILSCDTALKFLIVFNYKLSTHFL